ncbi:MAG TPA: hypothetical protein VGQ49_25690 [Bryobacteraceae bacterium]|jgi:hypothetical protein|nr:hypothetical protein [Bryobacteraceae bacterium]
MADARLEIKAGLVSFVGEGTEDWLAKQLDKLLGKLPEFARLPQSDPDAGKNDGAGQGGQSNNNASSENIGSLATYLKEKKATSNQSRKFLATAAWLQLGGMKRITTAEVTKTLSTHNQGKLTNASQCLNNNATSGNVVKDGKKQFYVAEEGFEELKK